MPSEKQRIIQALKHYHDAKFTPGIYEHSIFGKAALLLEADVPGQWIRLDAHKGIEQFKCSICRSECYVPTCMNEPMYGYCPNCGSKMDGERKDNG